MVTRRFSWIVTACGVTSLVGVVVAAATIWLLATEPLTVVHALDERNLSALALAVAETLGSAVKMLIRWL